MVPNCREPWAWIWMRSPWNPGQAERNSPVLLWERSKADNWVAVGSSAPAMTSTKWKKRADDRSEMR